MGFFSGIGRAVRGIVRFGKKIVKGAIGTVKGALKGDPMAMASLALMVYGGFQAGQFLFNKAAMAGLKTAGVAGGVGAGSATGAGTVFQAFGGTLTGSATGAVSGFAGGAAAAGAGGAGWGATAAYGGQGTSFFTGL